MKDRMVEELGRNIEDKKTMSKEYEGKVNKRIFSNILIAIVTLLYLIILILGSTNIDKDIFIVDLKVCSIILSLASILIFERSYKTSDGKLCVHGVETLILAIITLAAVYIFQTMNEIFTHIICGVAVAICFNPLLWLIFLYF